MLEETGNMRLGAANEASQTLCKTRPSDQNEALLQRILLGNNFCINCNG